MNIPETLDWMSVNRPALLALIRVLILVLPILILVPGFIWLERRLLSWMQDRIGPNRAGTFPKDFPIKFLRGKRTFGLLQPIADGVKLFFKEDITPASVDRLLYFLSPAVALFPAFALGGTLPWGPNWGPYQHLTPIWNAEIGILYMLAISSLGVYGVVLSGYSSNNKYSLLGGLRSAAQLISYELAMSVSLAAIVMASGSLRLQAIVEAQETPLWGVIPYAHNWFIFTPFGFVAAIIFYICMIAETNRAPFDLPEAENEIIAGYHTEYSSMKFAVFFMGEYAAMFVFACLFSVVFLGGYNLPLNWVAISGENSVMAGLNYWLAPLTFLVKSLMVFSTFIWVRATLPRMRYDQLMALGWKNLLPAAVANFIVVAIWIMGTKAYGPQGGIVAYIGAALIVVALYFAVTRQTKAAKAFERRTVDMTEGDTPSPTRRSVELV